MFTSRWMLMASPLEHKYTNCANHWTPGARFSPQTQDIAVSLKAQLLAYNICQIRLYSSDILGRCFITLDYVHSRAKLYYSILRLSLFVKWIKFWNSLSTIDFFSSVEYSHITENCYVYKISTFRLYMVISTSPIQLFGQQKVICLTNIATKMFGY